MTVSADQNNPLSPYGIKTKGSGGGSTSDTSTPTNPIGVPTGYKPPTSHSVVIGVPGTVQRTSTENVYGTPLLTNPYMPGDEFAPAGDLNAIPIIQADMIAAGLLKPSDVRRGVWDAASADAYKDVLAFANQQGVSASEALTILVSNPPGGKAGGAGGGGGGGRAAVISYTNPADLEATYSSTAQSLTGQEQQNPAFVDYYHGLESGAQHQTGTNYTAPPSAGAAAQQYIEQNDPSQVLAYGTASRMQDFLSMIGVK